MSAATRGVIARWSSRRPAPVCAECGEPTPGAAGTPCDGCGQLTGSPVGMLATVVDSPAGARLVVAKRVGGSWVPVSNIAATDEAVRMVRRQGVIETPAAGGGLW